MCPIFHDYFNFLMTRRPEIQYLFALDKCVYFSFGITVICPTKILVLLGDNKFLTKLTSTTVKNCVLDECTHFFEK